MKEGSTIWVSKKIKTELDNLKVIPEEPYNKVVERLVKFWKDKQ